MLIDTGVFTKEIKQRLASAQFVMLRYETEFTPCTGITAVTKQERRYFANGIVVAPWCSRLKRERGKDPVENGKVRATDWTIAIDGATCSVLATTDEFAPIVFLDIPGRFLGEETPYDTPSEPPQDHPPAHLKLATLKKDSLYFGLAVDALLKDVGGQKQFIWGADWETVPGLLLIRNSYPTATRTPRIALTLHNTFDECLAKEADTFHGIYSPFGTIRDNDGKELPSPTALQVGFEIADVVTTVNRGFADGMRTERLQKDVMAKHLQHLLHRVVGVNNGPFKILSKDKDKELLEIKGTLRQNFPVGRAELFALKSRRLAELPEHVKSKATRKVIFVSMGRRVAQKLHDVLVESVRNILLTDERFPILVVFATVHGDSGSPARLGRIEALAKQFPNNVVCEDGRLPYYKELMAAADFNCMPSLWEPHGGAYEGTVIPIARAVDGLAEQICALEPVGEAAPLNDRWHDKSEAATGFLFRETTAATSFLFHGGGDSLDGANSPTLPCPEKQSVEQQLRSLLNDSPSPDNGVFRAMREALSEVLRQAVWVRLNREDDYARLVLAALEKQEGWSWDDNLGRMLSLIEDASDK